MASKLEKKKFQQQVHLLMLLLLQQFQVWEAHDYDLRSH